MFLPTMRRCLVALCLLACMPAVGFSAVADEVLVKAGFLLNFAKFVEWPAASELFEFCIIGHDEMASLLETQLAGKSILSRPIAIRKGPSSRELSSCSIVYIGRAEKKMVPQIANSIAGKQILTVSEFPELGAKGITISFFSDEERIRFEIHLGAMKRSGLKISSKLLQVARTVD
jgi:hypothetical protein